MSRWTNYGQTLTDFCDWFSKQWRRGWRLTATAPLLSQNVFLENYLPQIQNLGLKIRHLGEFGGKIEILSSEHP